MKTFKGLEFNKRSILGARIAQLKFNNNYGISVITEGNAYAGPKQPYECAVTLNGYFCYTTHIANDVVGYCDADKVTKIMEQIQKLPPC